MYHTFRSRLEALEFLREHAEEGAKSVVWGYPYTDPRYVVFIPRRN